MSLRLAQHVLVLGAVALLGGVGGYALATRNSKPKPANALPHPATWYSAPVGVRGTRGYGHKTECGIVLTDLTLGVVHPVLPCGAKVFISFRGKQVLTEVVDRGTVAP